MPALLTRTSMRPRVETMPSTAARTASSTVTSTATGLTSGLSFRSSSVARAQRVGVAVEENDAGAVTCEPSCDREPDAARGARDDRDLAVEHHLVLMLRPPLRDLSSARPRSHTWRRQRGGEAEMASQASGVGLERRAVGLPTAIGTTFSLIVAGGVLDLRRAGLCRELGLPRGARDRPHHDVSSRA